MKYYDFWPVPEPDWVIRNIALAKPSEVSNLARIEYHKRRGLLMAVAKKDDAEWWLKLASQRSSFGGRLSTDRLVEDVIVPVSEDEARAFVARVNALCSDRLTLAEAASNDNHDKIVFFISTDAAEHGIIPQATTSSENDATPFTPHDPLC